VNKTSTVCEKENFAELVDVALKPRRSEQMTARTTLLLLALATVASSLVVPALTSHAMRLGPRGGRPVTSAGGRLMRLGPRAGRPVASASEKLDSNAADLNLLQTLLYDAVRDEEYGPASELRDRIAELTGAEGGDADWGDLDLPEWLSDWLGRLNFGMATRVQIQALRGLSERDGAMTRHRDAAIVAPTGSGKTLAYLLPMLKRFSADLLQVTESEFPATSLEFEQTVAKQPR